MKFDPIIKRLTLISVTLLLMNCATLQELAKIQKPTVKVNKVRVTGINLEKIDLAFDIGISNPNPLAATLAGFDYDFELGGSPFLNGKQNKQVTIEASGKSQIEFPVSLTFDKIYETYQSLKNEDSTTYKLALGLNFNLPILGNTRIPVSKSGNLPLVKIPKVNIASLKLKKLTFSNAKLDLKVDVKNPNGFSMALNKLDYKFKINGKTWATGLSQKKLQIKNSGKSTVTIPVTLNLIEMGRTVYNMITGNRSLNYDFSGDFNLDSSLPMLKNIDLPVTKSGQLKILK